MKLDFSRQALAEALIHVLIMAAASSISGWTLPEIQADGPDSTVQTLA